MGEEGVRDIEGDWELRYRVSEVGGCVRPGNLNGSCVRDPVAGTLEFD